MSTRKLSKVIAKVMRKVSTNRRGPFVIWYQPTQGPTYKNVGWPSLNAGTTDQYITAIAARRDLVAYLKNSRGEDPKKYSVRTLSGVRVR